MSGEPYLEDLLDTLDCAFQRKDNDNSQSEQFTVRPQDAELLFMSYCGTVEEVRAVLIKGANVEFRTRKGYTALIFASLYNTADVVRCLIEEGHANLEAKCKGGTALCFAALSDREDASVIRALVEAGADTNVLIIWELTPLMIASYSPQTPEKALALIEAGADINECHNGRDALIKAIIYGRFDNAKALISAGASTNTLLHRLQSIRDSVEVMEPESQNGFKGNEVIALLEAHVKFPALTDEHFKTIQAILSR